MDFEMNDVFLASVEEICSKYSNDKTNLLQILLEAQEKAEGNYIDEKTAKYIGEKLDVTMSRVYEVVTYFAALNEIPVGKNVIQICDSTACSVNEGKELVKWFEDELGINMGQTTEDKQFTLSFSPCFGACDISPAVRIGDEIIGNLTKGKVAELVQKKRGE